MGLVAVRLYGDKDFAKAKVEAAKAVEERNKDFSAKAEKIGAEAETARQTLNELQAELSRIEKDMGRLSQILRDADTGSPAFNKAADERLTLQSKLSDQKVAVNKATDSLTQLYEKRREAEAKTASAVDAIQARLGAPAAEGKTDADGKFQIQVAKGDYVIAASASREFGGDAEFYTWFVPHRAASGGVPVLLSNDNLEQAK